MQENIWEGFAFGLHFFRTVTEGNVLNHAVWSFIEICSGHAILLERA